MKRTTDLKKLFLIIILLDLMLVAIPLNIFPESVQRIPGQYIKTHLICPAESVYFFGERSPFFLQKIMNEQRNPDKVVLYIKKQGAMYVNQEYVTEEGLYSVLERAYLSGRLYHS